MVPPLAVFLAKHPAVDKYDLSSIQTIICGAAPLGGETSQAVKNRIGVKNIRQGKSNNQSPASVLEYGVKDPLALLGESIFDDLEYFFFSLSLIFFFNYL